MVFEQWSNSILNSIESSIVVMVIYQLIPLIVTTVIYSRICFKLNSLPIVKGEGLEIGRKRREQAAQTVRMLIAILVTYFVLSLPVSMVYNIETFRSGSRNVCNLETHKPLVLLCEFANIVNPFVICYYNKTLLRQGMRTIVSRAQTDGTNTEKLSSIQMQSTDV